jgi:hypothetical protein
MQCEVEGLSPQEAQVHIALVALAVISVAIAITASALNAIAISQKETRPDSLTAKFHGSARTMASLMSLCRKARRNFRQS